MTRMLSVLILGCTAIVSASLPAEADSGIAPIQSTPHGRSYGEWAARWWQWALETPASVNPLLDPSGEFAAVGQTGRVWFLAGSFGEPVNRTITVPTGTALFFPLINSAYFAFLTDPEDQRTEEFLRAAAAFPSTPIIHVEINGRPVSNPYQYFAQSPLDVQLPEDNVFGVDESFVPELRLTPSVDEGYYLFLNPLPPGLHTIRWMAATEFFTQDISYTIRVRPGRR